MMRALFLLASYSMTLILLAVNPSVFSWSMLGRLRKHLCCRTLRVLFDLSFVEHIQHG